MSVTLPFFIDSAKHYYGQEHFPVNDMLKKWTTHFGGTAIAAGKGHNGGDCILLDGNLSKTMDYNNSWIVGWRLKMESNSSNFGAQAPLYQLSAIGIPTFPDVIWARLTLNTDGTLSGCAGPNTTVFNTGPFTLHIGIWYYIEVKITISSGSSITIECRVDGVVRGTGSGNPGTYDTTKLVCQSAQGNFHTFSTTGVLGHTYMEDPYILNLANGTFSDYWGDVSILCLRPNADVVSEWTATTTPAYKSVNDTIPDYDSTIIKTNTANAVENFDWEDIATFSGTVPVVQYTVMARKDDEGSNSIKLTAGDDTSFPSPEFYLDDVYNYYTWPMLVGPSGGWTKDSFNGTRFGVQAIKVGS